MLAISMLLASVNLLVTPEWLSSQKDVVILHAGSAKDYAEGHIAGARLVTLADVSRPESKLRLEMPPAELMRERLRQWGIGDGTPVVVYAGNESIQTATRVWFTLDYHSLPASRLDGGLAAWKAKGLPVTTEAPTVTAAGSLTVRPRPELIVDAAWVKGHLGDAAVKIVDARLPEFYTGASAGNMPRAGHIPGAVSVPFPTLLTAGKSFLPAGELVGKLGAGETLVTYCHIGMQATVPYFAARLAGREVRLYDGSYEEWSGMAELPVEKQ
ncbi:MAG: sulfurtransferase [Acidobacteriota bacterium]